MLRLSEGLVECSREERQAMAAMYERETRREKVLGSKEKEGRGIILNKKTNKKKEILSH